MRFWDSCILYFCRLGVAGLAPKAPGTWGTAFACLLAPFVFLPLPPGKRVLVLIVLFILGALAASRAEKVLDRKDPGDVVIDEVVGMWLVLLPFAQPSLELFVVAFILFRLFDIFKPWPISKVEATIPGGLGIMLDDVVAALWALLCIGILRFASGFYF